MANWYPHLTVAAIIEQAGTFLLVEEMDDGLSVLNQPAGHLEEGETLIQAVIRETREETAHPFRPLGLVGFYQYRSPRNRVTYFRACFYGEAGPVDPELALDPDIRGTHWLSHPEILARKPSLRSPMVLQGVEDYLAGRRYPLDILRSV